jgi:hypothetical protein
MRTSSGTVFCHVPETRPILTELRHSSWDHSARELLEVSNVLWFLPFFWSLLSFVSSVTLSAKDVYST